MLFGGRVTDRLQKPHGDVIVDNLIQITASIRVYCGALHCNLWDEHTLVYKSSLLAIWMLEMMKRKNLCLRVRKMRSSQFLVSSVSDESLRIRCSICLAVNLWQWDGVLNYSTIKIFLKGLQITSPVFRWPDMRPRDSIPAPHKEETHILSTKQTMGILLHNKKNNNMINSFYHCIFRVHST